MTFAVSHPANMYEVMEILYRIDRQKGVCVSCTRPDICHHTLDVSALPVAGGHHAKPMIRILFCIEYMICSLIFGISHKNSANTGLE